MNVNFKFLFFDIPDSVYLMHDSWVGDRDRNLKSHLYDVIVIGKIFSQIHQTLPGQTLWQAGEDVLLSGSVAALHGLHHGCVCGHSSQWQQHCHHRQFLLDPLVGYCLGVVWRALVPDNKRHVIMMMKRWNWAQVDNVLQPVLVGHNVQTQLRVHHYLCTSIAPPSHDHDHLKIWTPPAITSLPIIE